MTYIDVYSHFVISKKTGEVFSDREAVVFYHGQRCPIEGAVIYLPPEKISLDKIVLDQLFRNKRKERYEVSMRSNHDRQS